MSTPEMKNGMDWAALGKQLLIPILLLAVIGVESSFLVLNTLDQNQTRKETDSQLQSGRMTARSIRRFVVRDNTCGDSSKKQEEVDPSDLLLKRKYL